MWISESEAYDLVRAVSSDIDDVRQVLTSRENQRDRLLSLFYPQGDIVTARLADAAGITPGRVRQIAAERLDDSLLDDLLHPSAPMPHFEQAIEQVAPGETITPERRVSVA